MQWYMKSFLMMTISALLCLIGYGLLQSGVPESMGFFVILVGWFIEIVGLTHWLLNVIVIKLEKGD